MAALTPGRSSEGQREAKRQAILAALETGHTRRAAAQLAGVSHVTLYAWMADDLPFSNAVTRAEAAAEEYYLSCIKAQASQDWRAGAWYMERRRSEDYARKDTVTVLAKLSKELDNLSDADLIALAAGDGAGDTAPDGAGEAEAAGD